MSEANMEPVTAEEAQGILDHWRDGSDMWRLARTLLDQFEIVNGRDHAPTDREIDEHYSVNGAWVCGDEIAWKRSEVREMRANNPGGRWIALDSKRRPCAWPKS